ncbi:hypothetical protein KFE25_010141 [Diacronema lutheri]|uniref:Tetratricopeptide repeat protein n=1 Tax=Diacronema lutheri TaxID=2081491 RepID=A0A8J5XI37_DIALT|nr:hypothetical protein KFE25_010141 [Diacronema lutheri]
MAGHEADADEVDNGLNGHVRSPALREAERELAAVKMRVDGLSAVGRVELDAMMRAGHEKLARGRPGGSYEQATRGALECFAACYVMARTLELPRAELDALSTAALCYRQLGRPEVAIVMLRACVELSARHDDVQGEAHALGNAALALRSLGQLDEAIAMQRESARLAMSCGDWQCAVRAHVNAANVLLLRAAEAADRAAGAASSSGLSNDEHRAVARRDAEALLRAALALVDEHARARDDGGTTELEANVCARLAAALEIEGRERSGEATELYRRALGCIELLAGIDVGGDEQDARAAHHRQQCEVLRRKVHQVSPS